MMLRFAFVNAIARRGRGETDATDGHSIDDEGRDVAAVIHAVGEPVRVLPPLPLEVRVAGHHDVVTLHGRRILAMPTVFALIAAGAALTTLMTVPWQLYLLWGIVVGLGTGTMATVFADAGRARHRAGWARGSAVHTSTTRLATVPRDPGSCC